MLRSEHVMARLYRGRLVPHRLSPDDRRTLAVAEELCDLYAAHVGLPRSSLERELTVREEGLGPGLDSRRGFKIVRALSKLLEERAGWTAPTEADPYTLRTRVFELAAALPEPPAAEAGLLELPTRGDVLSQVAAETGVEDPAASMYADRQGAQLLGDFDRPSPGELVRRYNVAQVQGVLYSAREIVVDLGARGRREARVPLRQASRFDLRPRTARPRPPAPPRRSALHLRWHPQVRAAPGEVPSRPADDVPLGTLGKRRVEGQGHGSGAGFRDVRSGESLPGAERRARGRRCPRSIRPCLGKSEGHGRLGARTGRRCAALPRAESGARPRLYTAAYGHRRGGPTRDPRILVRAQPHRARSPAQGGREAGPPGARRRLREAWRLAGGPLGGGGRGRRAFQGPAPGEGRTRGAAGPTKRPGSRERGGTGDP